MKCPICSSAMSEPVRSLLDLPSVTSDCRPWSVGRSVQICEGCGVMRRYVHPLADFNTIYRDYKSYPEPAGRTRKILEFVSDKMPAPKSILDIGCGEGHGLKALEAHYPNAAIVGYEPHSTNPAIMNQRPALKYDLITLFHVLEHIEDVHEMLGYVKSALNEGGHVLIQVPYTLMWPFDLVLADHCWHFNEISLDALSRQNGFEIVSIGNQSIAKEITLLARPIIREYEIDMKDNFSNREAIDWLLSYKTSLDTIDHPVAVYGTGPAAAWAGGILGDKVVCYIDDDSDRWGGFNGKSVVAIIDKHIPVVAPFPDWQLPSIKAKHPELKFLC